MNNQLMAEPCEVVRDFFQELVAGLFTGNMGAIDRHMTSDVEMIIVGTTFARAASGHPLRWTA
jgi:hypothetical protein